MSVTATHGDQLKLPVYLIYREDFPERFDEFKSSIEAYIDVKISFQANEDIPVLKDYWILQHIVSDLPYCIENNTRIQQAIDIRLDQFLSFFKTDDSIVSTIFKQKVLSLTTQSLAVNRITPKELQIVKFPWANVPKHKKGFFPMESNEDLQVIRAERTQGSIGILLTAMYEAGFLTQHQAKDLYPILSLLTGYSSKGWINSFALKLPTLIKRGYEVSETDIETVQKFLSETQASIQEIREKLGKSRRRKNIKG